MMFLYMTDNGVSTRSNYLYQRVYKNGSTYKLLEFYAHIREKGTVYKFAMR